MHGPCLAAKWLRSLDTQCVKTPVWFIQLLYAEVNDKGPGADKTSCSWHYQSILPLGSRRIYSNLHWTKSRLGKWKAHDTYVAVTCHCFSLKAAAGKVSELWARIAHLCSKVDQYYHHGSTLSPCPSAWETLHRWNAAKCPLAPEARCNVNWCLLLQNHPIPE